MAEGTADGHGSATVRRLDPGLFDEAMKDQRERHAASDAQALADGFPTSDSWFRTADVEAAAAALGIAPADCLVI